MLARFLQIIKKHALFNISDKLLVAVSGGVDSMVLCELLRQGDFNFAIAHCNFQLRGDDSDGDALFVRNYANENGITHFENTFETIDKAHSEGISIQMAARDLRYQWFSELLERHQFDYLLTAHHLNDTAETVLMNIVRGTSIHGLKGIDFKTDLLRRPLSFFNKKELMGFANSEDLAWRVDASNADNKYFRNAIRNNVVPQLEELNPGFLQHIDELTEKNKVVEQVWNRHVNELRKELVSDHVDRLTIVKRPFVEGKYSAFELFELIADKGFNYEQAKSILDSLETTGARFLSSTNVLFVEREFLTIKKKEEGLNSEMLISELDGEVIYEGLHLLLSKVDTPKKFNVDYEYFDFEKLNFPLKLRRWQQGDRMRPLGMKGTKLVSDILIDKKVEASRKEHTYVLLSGDEVCWLIGYQISQTFCLDKSTQKALKVSMM